jgi:putative transcriptional regulator
MPANMAGWPTGPLAEPEGNELSGDPQMERRLDIAGSVKHAFHMRNRVRELRERAGLSQARLGEAVGVSRQTINSIERDRYLPSLPLAFELARFFDMPIEEVFDAEQ